MPDVLKATSRSLSGEAPASWTPATPLPDPIAGDRAVRLPLPMSRRRGVVERPPMCPDVVGFLPSMSLRLNICELSPDTSTEASRGETPTAGWELGGVASTISSLSDLSSDGSLGLPFAEASSQRCVPRDEGPPNALRVACRYVCLSFLRMAIMLDMYVKMTLKWLRTCIVCWISERFYLVLIPP